jgi:3-deoxy-D-manno-octulosonic-acid transferase
LSASTHEGEEAFALEAFADLRSLLPGSLLVIAPRHPDRGPAVAELAGRRGFVVQRRSADAGWPGQAVDVLVADTMGELVFWYVVADRVYLGGATAQNVGGHNAIEAAQVGQHVFTGPHGYNFREIFDGLRMAGALTIGASTKELAEFWLTPSSQSEAGDRPAHA